MEVLFSFNRYGVEQFRRMLDHELENPGGLREYMLACGPCRTLGVELAAQAHFVVTTHDKTEELPKFFAHETGSSKKFDGASEVVPEFLRSINAAIKEKDSMAKPLIHFPGTVHLIRN